ncbi:hypothetical protein AGABI2DRAFT_223422 [Agaricus bisporus var. bisporus H97]|uniref:hypothetical protein n=1 Tax=Agaricus bisporus var. bisporus (strain H97 / ATCC MYA-4626 / FGSC 10389) TaxID=936046 RepID=UPI00029F74ED|nr:hypothetical protein AGABI2DRAFT_223422 [Agaricus bisporus var. bisporus H97]EKV46860.1 hypothetical protein AGABI2DRAFT_223422 [Agaricus bisporus var. bisporus H97]
MPHSSLSSTTQADNNTLHHGATLSSFTSIAMDPYPLVTFALRIPSRMATTLNTTTSTPEHEKETHLIINLLSSTQAKHAVAFSRPDLYPTPFTDPEIPYTLSQDGLPVLDGCLGAISCRLVGPGLPLNDLGSLTNTLLHRKEDDTVNSQWQVNGAIASELFIAQVIRVEALASAATLPLLYHRRKYTSCIPCPPGELS